MFQLFSILAIIIALTSSSFAQVVIISEGFSSPPAEVSKTDAPPTARPAVFLTSKTVCAGGYCWTYSNGGKVDETFAEFTKRTGKLPAETRFTCSSGFCGTAAKSPTLATGQCTCGCAGTLCNCSHSPNAGKPLAQQKVEPGKAVTSNNTYTRRLFRRWR